MKKYTLAPGLPEIEEGNYLEPTACIVESAIRHFALPMMEATDQRVKITMAPVDFLDLHTIQSWAVVELDSSLDNGNYAKAIIQCGGDGVYLHGISRKRKPQDGIYG